MSCLNNYNLDVILKQLNCWCENWRGQIQTIFPSGMTQIEQIQQLFTAVKNTASAQLETMEKFCELYEFVNDYFNNLDVQKEINNKLEEMIENGSFANVITPLIVQYSTPHFVESNEEMTNHAYIYVLASTGNVWAWNGSEFADTGVEYIGGINNILRMYGTLPDGDLNTITQNAIYLLSSTNSYQNAPFNVGTLFHINYSSNYAVQLAYRFTYGYYYYRQKENGTWSAWRRSVMSYGADISDANNAEIMSLYIGDNIANMPSTGNYFLYTYGGTQASAKMQYAVRFSDSRIFVRVYSVAQSKWLEWYENSFLNGCLAYVGALSETDNIDELKQNTLYVYDPSIEKDFGLPEKRAGYIQTQGSGSVKVQYYIRTSNARKYVRYYGASKWSSWINDNSFYMGTELKDCNLALAESLYILSPGEIDNLPIEATGYLFTYGVDSASRIQFYVTYNTGDIYFRHTVVPFSENKYTSWSKYSNDSGGFITNAKLFSVGNSILTGSVWTNGEFNHLSKYGNAPYSVIADGMHIPEGNVIHTLLSSTGLLYDAGQGTFLSKIKNTDLKNYDVVLTHLWTADMNSGFNLGSIDSTAGDGTIAGAVVDLINYMKSNNSMCQLVLVGIPPVSTTVEGDTVFSGAFPNGSSISQCDKLMHELANKYHFTFVDWEDLNISYCFRNFTDGDNVHANNENTYRVMGAYLAGRISAKLCF